MDAKAANTCEHPDLQAIDLHWQAKRGGRDYQIFDTDVRGFAVMHLPSGGRAFTLDYRHAGRQRRMTFGRWPEWSVSAARERAKEMRREIDAGADPLGQRETLREAPRWTI
jgi:hypothetical protein